MALTLIYNPLWFHGIDVVLEVFSILAAVLICIVGYKAYKLTREGKYFYFSLAFGLITLSFLARAITTGVVLSQLTASAAGQAMPLTINAVESIFSLGKFAYFLLVLMSYLIIFALSMRITNKRLIFLMSVFMILFSATAFTSSPLIFYMVSLALLFMIAWKYRDNHLLHRSTSTLLTVGAFALMVLEFVMFILSGWTVDFVVAAYFFRLIAYVMLLVMIVRVYTK